MRTCSNCNQVIHDTDSEFCNKCGAKLVQPSLENEKRKGKYCTNCGSALENTSKFCSACGTEVEGLNPTHTPATKNVRLSSKNKKNIFIGIAIIIVIIIAGKLLLSANSPFKKVEGYWYTQKYDNYIKLEPKGDKMIDITFYDTGDSKVIHGTVLSHTSKNIEISVTEDGETNTADLKLNDNDHLSLVAKNKDGSIEETMNFEKKSKDDFDKHYFSN